MSVVREDVENPTVLYITLLRNLREHWLIRFGTPNRRTLKFRHEADDKETEMGRPSVDTVGTTDHLPVVSGPRMASRMHLAASEKRQLKMHVDNPAALAENPGLFAAQPKLAPVIHDCLGSMPVLVLDFDALRIEDTLQQLKSASEMCRFVVWYPWSFTPAEVVGLHRELVDSGATLIEKTSPDQSFESCWLRRKAELDERERRRLERAASRAVRTGSVSAGV